MQNNKLNRILSMFLAIVLVITLFPNVAVTTHAETNLLGNKVIELALKENNYYAGANQDNKYGQEFWKNNDDWCALFVAWCMKHAGVPTTVYNWVGEKWNLPASTDNNAIAAPSLIRSGKFHYRDKDDYVPKAGDTIYFDWKYRSPYIENSMHVELVVSYKDGVLTTIGGNTVTDDGKVSIRTIRKSDYQYKAIIGYGEIDYSGKMSAIIPCQIPRPYYEGYSYTGGGGGIMQGSNNPDDHIVPTYTLGLNSRGDSVQWVQAMLNNLCGTTLSIDGIYGNGTKNAVRSFQSSRSLFPVDGIVGPVTRDRMIVEWNAKKYIAPSSIVINTKSLDVTVGKTKQLSSNIEPGNATDKSIKWTSSNSAVATVKNGVITGVKEGTATITATTCNGKTASCKVQVYKPYTITFVNDDGNVLSTQTIEHGASATAPKNPEKEGYVFAGWNGTYQNVRCDATITATYTKKLYKVTFKETDGTVIGSRQEVAHGEAAIAPDISDLHIPEGYSFEGWSEDFECVKSDIEVYPIYKWADEELPISVSVDENTGVGSYEKGTYAVSFNLMNHSEKEQRARVMIYMITDEGKMVAQGETRTVKIPSATVDESGSIVDGSLTVNDMYVVCNSVADKARIVVLDDFESAVPLAEIKDIDVEISGYGEWTDKEPADADVNYMSRTVYRSKAVNYKTSTTANTITGWTLYDTSSVKSGNGDKVWYASGKSVSAPSKSGVHRVWSEPIYYEHDPNVYTVPTYNISISTTGGVAYQNMVKWIQCCLCRFGYYTEIDGVYGYNTASVMKIFQRDHGLSADGIVGAATRSFMQNKLNEQHVYNYYYESLNTENTYYFYQVEDEWSDWKTEAIVGDTELNAGTTQMLVESKKQYSYKNDLTESVGTFMNPECKLPEDAIGLAGKDAVVIVFKNKVNQIAEDNVQYIGDTVIGEDGNLDISFIPREEQTYEGTGDYTVVLGVKGTTNYVKVGTIEAPKPVYTVTFVDEDGTELSTQNVEEGNDAEVPVSPSKEGYIFTGWDTGVTNVHSNLTITAEYKKKQYSVSFIDWENRTFESESYEYGDIIIIPEEPKVPEDMEFVGWGVEENTTITKDVVYEAQYIKKEFTVIFVDWNGNVVIEEKIGYGESAMAPEIVEEGVDKEHTVPNKIGDMYFVSWGEDTDLRNVTNNLVIGAIYQYDKFVSVPRVSLESGEYNTEQQVELTTDESGVQIFYTIDGSDPTDPQNVNVKEYDSPISIEETTKLRYYASSTGMNDSKIAEQWYVINKENETEKHLVTVKAINVFDSSEVSDYQVIVEDKAMIDLMNELDNEYSIVELQGIYQDEDLSTEWNGSAITDSITLYAMYDLKQFEITYCDEDGNVLIKDKVAYGSAVDDGIAPRKDGYHFVGWMSDENCNSVTQDMVVTASYVLEEEYAVIKFERNQYTMMEGSMLQLSPTVTYKETGNVANDEMIQWSVSDNNIAAVDTEGNVSALAKGEITIKATVQATGESAECTISITGNPDSSICVLDNADCQVEKGYLINITLENNTVSNIKQQLDAKNLKFYDESNIELTDSDYVGTGTRIQMLNEDGALLDEVVVVINGDYNGDGVINGRDVSGLIRYLIGKEDVTDVRLKAMDVNGDSVVNNRDAALLARYIVGKEAFE